MATTGGGMPAATACFSLLMVVSVSVWVDAWMEGSKGGGLDSDVGRPVNASAECSVVGEGDGRGEERRGGKAQAGGQGMQLPLAGWVAGSLGMQVSLW